MNELKAILLLLLIVISSLNFVGAESEPVVPFHPRISSVISWLLSQVVYDQEQTGYAASLFSEGEDYYRLYTDDNARLARVLTVSLQYYINEFRDHPFAWDDKIKVAINFVKDAQTPTIDFSHYWQLSNPDDEPVGWQRSGEFYFWNAAVKSRNGVVGKRGRKIPIIPSASEMLPAPIHNHLINVRGIVNVTLYTVRSKNPYNIF
ncbi:hypothetical protein A3K80_04645 [Candidatus Bathyarchaeota archaeon RBG_13_38_9]|nr:MAG: hypothetical protein A3K80_04645 [Candidatus Bathyarchaeota archaeon RBG_13_38_9]